MLLYYLFQLIVVFIHLPMNILGNHRQAELVPQTVIPVYWNVEIVDISKINVENMDFRLDFNIRQSWIEENLNITGVFLYDNQTSVVLDDNDDVLSTMWNPDFYVPNARQSAVESLRTATSNTILHRNKTIIYTARLWVVLGCQMEFQWYPMDVQQCELIIESYSYPTNQVKFQWAKEDPVIILDDIKLLRYSIGLPLRYKNTVIHRFKKQEQYSKVSILFTFQRLIGNQIIQTFLPTFLVVSLSWFSFWLGLDAIPGRISILVTSMLTLVTMFSGSKSNLPPVAYIKMMDIWTITCMIFVFAAMCEFIIVKRLSDISNSTPGQSNMTEIIQFELGNYRKPQQKQNILSDRHDSTKSSLFGNQFLCQPWTSTPNSQHDFKTSSSDTRSKEIWQKIDRTSKVAFPVLFFSFIIIYAPILAIGSGNEIYISYPST